MALPTEQASRSTTADSAVTAQEKAVQMYWLDVAMGKEVGDPPGGEDHMLQIAMGREWRHRPPNEETQNSK